MHRSRLFACLVLAALTAACVGQPAPAPTNTPLPPTDAPTATPTGTPTPMVTQQFPQDGLAAYYPFEGNAADASGNHNDGTLSGPILTSDRFGFEDSAYSFDGEDDYIVVPDSDSLEFTADFSLALWLQPNADDKPHSDFLLYKIPAYDPNGIRDAWWFGLVRDEANRLRFSTAPRFDHDSVSAHGIRNDTWSCVAFTYRASDQLWTFYINGSMDSQGTNDRRQIGNHEPITIGGMLEATGTMFSGKMDDIAIYQRTLAPEEVADYCNNNPEYLSQLAIARLIPSPTETPAGDCTHGWTRLNAGMQAAVVSDAPSARLRAEPAAGENVIALLDPGSIVQLLQGPVCRDGLVLWKVQVDIPGISTVGWTAEGDGTEYYLEPYQP